MDIIN